MTLDNIWLTSHRTNGYRTFRSALLPLIAAVFAALFVAMPPANAAIIISVDQFDDDGNRIGTTRVDNGSQGEAEVDEEGTVHWHSTQDIVGDGWSIPLEVDGQPAGMFINTNADPFITHGFTFVNTTGATGNFVISISNTSIDEIPFPLISGETNYDLTDTNGNGATLDQSGSGEALYNAFFSGDGDVRDLIPPEPGLPVTTTNPQIGNIAAAYANEAIGPAIGLSNGEDFGIRHEFRLTPFDRVTVQSTFEILPDPNQNEIPEPATATLCLLGISSLALLARRQFVK